MLEEKFVRKFVSVCPNAPSLFGLVNILPFSPPKSVKPENWEFLNKIYVVVAEAVNKGTTIGLSSLWISSSNIERATILGEAIFCLAASKKVVSSLAVWTFESMNEFSTSLLQAMIDIGPDDETKKILLAVREWTITASSYFCSFNTQRHGAQCFFVRAQITSIALASRPDLVGESMVSAVRQLASINELATATDFCRSVCNDLESLVELIAEEDCLETRRGIFWLNEACSFSLKLGLSEFRVLKRRVERTIRTYDIRSFQDKPRFGSVISLYLSQVEWLAELLTDFGKADEGDDETLEELCMDYGVTEFESSVIDRGLDCYLDGSLDIDMPESGTITVENIIKAVQLAESREASQ